MGDSVFFIPGQLGHEKVEITTGICESLLCARTSFTLANEDLLHSKANEDLFHYSK